MQARLTSFLTLIVVGIVGSSLGCTKRDTPPANPSATPVTTSGTEPAKASGLSFRNVAAEAGLNYQWSPPGKRPLTILGTIGNGCAFLDYNNDGNLDILLVGPTPALFKGDGKGHFTDVSKETGIASLKGYLLGCAVGDYDNDGYPDIYLSGYRDGRLLHNEGGHGFKDVTATSGVEPQPWGTSAGFADLDGDGYLDLYICNYADFSPTTKPQLCRFQTKDHGEVLSSCGPRYYNGVKGVMYHNLHGKTFEDLTLVWGFTAHSGRGLGVAFADIDGSGRIATAVANDEAPGDLFYRKTQGDMKHQNIGEISGTARDHNGSLHGGMGVDFGDYNNDGKMDLFVATFRNEAKDLYRNDGDTIFTDVSYPVGVARPALPYVTFGAKFFDADNDGWQDIILCNGHVQDNVKLIENIDYPEPVVLMHNAAPGQFEDATQASGIGNLPPVVGRGLATGDYDNDGKMDVLIVDSEGKPLLLHNESKAGNWVGFRLIGKNKRDAYNAVVAVTAGGITQTKQCQSAGSYMSASDPRVHFGLGTATTIDKVTIRWPDGKKQTISAPEINKYILLTQP